ncbi:MAG: hypothetical protein NVS1B14_01820 [Vulcanimicrobiaceae bacterium]
MQAGFSILEVVLSVSFLTLVMLATTWTFGQRPAQRPAAVAQMEAQVAAARSLAAGVREGATIIVQPRAGPNGATTRGFRSVLYAGRPYVIPLATQPLGPVVAEADIVESATGAVPPFAIFVSPSGHFRVLAGYPPPASFDTPDVPAVGAEPPCPLPQGRPYALVLSTDSGSKSLALPCSASAPGTPLPWRTP